MTRRLWSRLAGFISGRNIRRERERNQAKADKLDMTLRELLKQ